MNTCASAKQARWEAPRVERLALAHDLAGIAKLNRRGDLVRRDVGRTERGPEVVAVLAEPLGGGLRLAEELANRHPVVLAIGSPCLPRWIAGSGQNRARHRAERRASFHRPGDGEGEEAKPLVAEADGYAYEHGIPSPSLWVTTRAWGRVSGESHLHGRRNSRGRQDTR